MVTPCTSTSAPAYITCSVTRIGTRGVQRGKELLLFSETRIKTALFLRVGLKWFSNYLMDCHEILYRHSRCTGVKKYILSLMIHSLFPLQHCDICDFEANVSFSTSAINRSCYCFVWALSYSISAYILILQCFL